MKMNTKIERSDAQILLKIKENLPKAKTLLENCNREFIYEDLVYRFYHQSFKVYRTQSVTIEIVDFLKSITPNEELNPWFLKIVDEGVAKEFNESHNRDWLLHTRPIIEAFFHAKYFLEMIVKYGQELSEAPDSLPSGWASVLYLYNSR